MERFLRLTQLLVLLFAILSGCIKPFSAEVHGQVRSAEQAVWLEWESASAGKEGDASRLVVKLQGAELANLGAAQFELSFPANTWEFSQAGSGPMLSSALLESNLIEPGRIKVAFVSSESIDGTGTLLELEFQRFANQDSTESVSLENFQAWRQADSSESNVVIRPSTGSTHAAGPPLSQPTEQTPASAPAASASLNSPVIVTAPPPELRFPEAFTVKLELPGWQWFVTGAFAGLLIGGLLGWGLHRIR